MKIIKHATDVKKSKKEFRNQYKKHEPINVQATAKEFGVSRVTVYNWIKEINKTL